jgi:tRNA pseudouridine38-40 synthase
MGTYKLLLEYDGTNYVGWQIQPNGTSVQSELEKALAQILQEPVATVAAGRTDAGVHARGQVASFRTSALVQVQLLRKGLNGVLPSNIAVLSCEPMPDDFHARHSAKGRRYSYCLATKPTAIARNFSWYVGGYQLDRDLLAGCASMLLGEHDFSSFCKAHSSTDDFVCKLEQSRWTETASSLVYEIKANRFLYTMVRTIVGTMVEVARGHRRAGEFQEILEARDRTRAGMAAPAKGLFLEEIQY